MDQPELVAPPSLVSYARDGRCALFVGAGLSRPAGYPGWSELMHDIVREVTSASLKEELEKLLDKGKFAEVADQCRDLLGRTRFYRVVRSRLSAPADPPEATHRSIVDIPWKCIVTTNFDVLLEDAYVRWSDRGVPRTPTGTQLMHHGTLLLDGGFFILKAHGTLEDESSMVFTSEDYRRITHANPAFNQMLSAILLSNCVLFVGYSLSDPNFLLLLEAQLSTFGAEVPRRYILMEAVGRAEEELLWRTARVRVISYPKGQHQLVARFLASLAQSVRDSQPVAARSSRRRSRRQTARDLASHRVLRVELAADHTELNVRWSRVGLKGPRVTNATGSEPINHGSATLPAWHQLRSAVKRLGFGEMPTARMGQLLAGALPAPLRRELASRENDVVVLVPSNSLECLPWEWADVNGAPLFVRRAVVRQSAEVSNSSRGRRFLQTPPRLLLIGDSGSAGLQLPGSRREVRELKQLVASVVPKSMVTVLVGKAASYRRVLSEIEHGDYDLIHFTGHVGRSDDGERGILLFDGYVQGTDLTALLAPRPPAIFVVNGGGAIDLPFGQLSPTDYERGQPTAEVLEAESSRSAGLARVAARAGVGTFVGGFGSLTDENSARFGITFYRQLLAAQTVAQAFWLTRREMHKIPESYFFLMSGYPDLLPFRSKEAEQVVAT